MPIYTKKEFASEFKIATKDLSVYIKRGKVVAEGDTIDSGNLINSAWCIMRQEYLKKKEAKAGPIPEISPEDKLNNRSAGQKNDQVKLKFEPSPETKQTLQESFQADAKLKQLNLTKTENEIAMQNEKLRKIQGESIPTDLVKNLFAQHSKSITVAFRNAADNLLMEITQKHALSSIEMGSLRDKLIKIINEAVNKSVDETQKGLKTIVEEYSVKKGVGEHGG